MNLIKGKMFPFSTEIKMDKSTYIHCALSQRFPKGFTYWYIIFCFTMSFSKCHVALFLTI